MSVINLAGTKPLRRHSICLTARGGSCCADEEDEQHGVESDVEGWELSKVEEDGEAEVGMGVVGVQGGVAGVEGEIAEVKGGEAEVEGGVSGAEGSAVEAGSSPAYIVSVKDAWSFCAS